MKQQSSKATIIVGDPEVKKEYGGARQYYTYSIKGEDSRGIIDIHRRYSDFDLIKNILLKRWPGCYIPSLPSKVKISNSNEQFLQIRSKYLQKFLVEVSKKPYLWFSDQMQIFLRNSMTDFEKMTTTFWKISLPEIVYRYQLHFKDIKCQNSQLLQQKINQFGKQLSVLYVKIQELRNRSQELNNAQSRYQKKCSKFLLNTLASYEDRFLTYYNQGNAGFNAIFACEQTLEKKSKLEESLKEVPLKILFEELKREKREISSIQESIKSYQEYLKERQKVQEKIKEHESKISQIKGGKKSFLSKIRNLSSDDDINSHEKSIEKYKLELGHYNKICQFMRIILGEIEIEDFKKERTVSYYKMVQQIAREEINIIEKERDFWISICKNNFHDFEIEEPKQPIRSENTGKELSEKEDSQAKIEPKSEQCEPKIQIMKNIVQNQECKQQIKPELVENSAIKSEQIVQSAERIDKTETQGQKIQQFHDFSQKQQCAQTENVLQQFKNEQNPIEQCEKSKKDTVKYEQKENKQAEDD